MGGEQTKATLEAESRKRKKSAQPSLAWGMAWWGTVLALELSTSVPAQLPLETALRYLLFPSELAMKQEAGHPPLLWGSLFPLSTLGRALWGPRQQGLSNKHTFRYVRVRVYDCTYVSVSPYEYESI